MKMTNFISTYEVKETGSYKEIEDDSEKIKMEADQLLKAKKDLEL